MEMPDDDVFVVIIESGKEYEKVQSDSLTIQIKGESVDSIETEQIIEAATIHGELIDLTRYIDVTQDSIIIKENDVVNLCSDDILTEEGESFNDIKEEPLNEECNNDIRVEKVHRSKMLPSSQRKSLVKELKKQFPDSVKGKINTSALIETLAEIMFKVKTPPPPQDYYIMNGINFECTTCGDIKDTYPAIGRHYQEKHGPRYLICYACGVDFRSTTNLYKHEKNCISPDIKVVLKARAIFLGRKARNRPFQQNTDSYLCQYRAIGDRRLTHAAPEDRPLYPCDECSAVYLSTTSLVSHMNMHRGECPHRCKFCTAAYTSQSALARHMKTHSGAQFICNHCERTFKIKEALIVHLDTHLPVKKYPCKECDKRYAHKPALLLHINKVHRKLPPPFGCQLCPRRFQRMSVLKDHMKKEHGMVLLTRRTYLKTLPKLTRNKVSQSQLQKAKVILKSETSNVDPVQAEVEVHGGVDLHEI